jgi:hypothetical protein
MINKEHDDFKGFKFVKFLPIFDSEIFFVATFVVHRLLIFRGYKKDTKKINYRKFDLKNRCILF